MTGIDNWEYARWTTVIGRSLRFNPAENPSVELTACQQFLTAIKVLRPWLDDTFRDKSEQEQGLVTTDNPQVLGKQITIIGRDMMKIQVQNIIEKMIIDILITATGNRRYGSMGGGIGSDVVNP